MCLKITGYKDRSGSVWEAWFRTTVWFNSISTWQCITNLDLDAIALKFLKFSSLMRPIFDLFMMTSLSDLSPTLSDVLKLWRCSRFSWTILFSVPGLWLPNFFSGFSILCATQPSLWPLRLAWTVDSLSLKLLLVIHSKSQNRTVWSGVLLR